VVLYRPAAGRVAALEDRCRHRQAPLSLGRLVGDEVECGYHGLRFDGTGRCTLVPGQVKVPRVAGPAGRPEAPGVRSYPVVERHGFIWIWMDDGSPADPAAIPDYHWHTEPGWEVDHFYVNPRSSYTLAIDNLLDLSHATFLHRGNVGSQALVDNRPETVVSPDQVEVRRRLRDVENSATFAALMGFPRVDNLRGTVFRPPGDVRIYTIYEPPGNPDPGRQRVFQVLTPVTPETATSHHQFLTHCRNFPAGAVRPRFVRDIEVAMAEDQAMLESQQRSQESDRAGRAALNLATDQGPLAARRLLDQLERRERPPAARAPGRPGRA
jgi:vanillate O-demethylase monooxygenase subunit